MNHAPLFTGINGFGLAANWMGWNQPFHCEIDEFCQRVIQYYWPNSIPYYDITKTDFTRHRGTIDVLTGGFPCQPYSIAGKRKGKEDDRHLWPEMLRAIREIAPSYVVGENVYGLVNWDGGLVFNEVQTDLEAEGYEVWPVILPACAVNAPHRRDRVWFVAYNTNARFESMQRGRENGIYEFGITPDPNSPPTKNEIQTRGNEFRSKVASNTSSSRRIQNDIEQQPKFKPISPSWERFPTQPPVCNGNDGLPSRLDGITFPKWRSESIKAGGNAIVPQIAFEIFKAIEYIDTHF